MSYTQNTGLNVKSRGFLLCNIFRLKYGLLSHIGLKNPFSKQLCKIVLPFGKYEYQRLPMGLCNSPDIFQEKISELMLGLDYV
jgi:hypothetical protein